VEQPGSTSWGGTIKNFVARGEGMEAMKKRKEQAGKLSTYLKRVFGWDFDPPS